MPRGRKTTEESLKKFREFVNIIKSNPDIDNNELEKSGYTEKYIYGNKPEAQLFIKDLQNLDDNRGEIEKVEQERVKLKKQNKELEKELKKNKNGGNNMPDLTKADVRAVLDEVLEQKPQGQVNIDEIANKAVDKIREQGDREKEEGNKIKKGAELAVEPIKKDIKTLLGATCYTDEKGVLRCISPTREEMQKGYKNLDEKIEVIKNNLPEKGGISNLFTPEEIEDKKKIKDMTDEEKDQYYKSIPGYQKRIEKNALGARALKETKQKIYAGLNEELSLEDRMCFLYGICKSPQQIEELKKKGYEIGKVEEKKEEKSSKWIP